MDKELGDCTAAQKTFRTDLDLLEDRTMDVEMSAQGAHRMLAEMKEEVWDFSDSFGNLHNQVETVRADCLATNTEYCDRCTHAATQATNVARIKTEGTKGLLQGQVAG
jgi:hypothetical protein